MKLSDYVAIRIKEHGIKHVFMLTGGGAMYLNHSLGNCEGLETIFNLHEQGCAIAAEGYVRICNKPVVVNVTTGPGGLNTLTGVMGQWTDSVPVIYISGQVKYQTTIHSCKELDLRQLGDQEVDIISVVKPLTKYATMITDPRTIKKEIDKALYIATHGRPGPVWLDIPMDVQGAEIDENELFEFDPAIFNSNPDELKIYEIISLLKKSERPVIIAGNGVRISNGIDVFHKFVAELRIPVLTTFNGIDLIETDNEFYTGKIGVQGDRAGNFALQNADLAIFLGTRNNIRQVTYNWHTFAQNAKKIVVDIDQAELKKKYVIPDIAVNADVKVFMETILKTFEKESTCDFKEWLEWCMDKKERYPVVLDEYKECEKVQPYYFVKELTGALGEGAVVVAGNATASITLMQAGIIKKGQRMFSNSGCASMGYGLPAAIGACIANDKKDTVCITGDGSFQMNIQELSTVKYLNLPLKIFYLNNDGYISMRQTQKNFFNGKITGSDTKTGLFFPDIRCICDAYGIGYKKITGHEALIDNISYVLNLEGPVICEVMLQNDYIYAPKVSSTKDRDGNIYTKPIDDMFPFLSEEEYLKNKI